MSTVLNLDEAGVSVRAGRIALNKGSKKLYVKFYYHGVRVEKSSGLDDTPKNRVTLQKWLDAQMDKIENGTFVFAEAFPGASEEEKAFHAAREGWEYRPEPHSVLFENYVATWRKTILACSKSLRKQYDWNLAIDYWLLPYFGGKTFHQIHAVEIQKFVGQLNRLKGKRKGEALSRSRINNILIPFRAIWSDASEENHWDLPDPFRFIKKHLPMDEKKAPRRLKV
ncbi:MAG: DUF3596 domain-containing protein [Desulfobacteraceae bacterium]|nr:DUF3596 domain-containing protein [Desulfobacteraceae bacterium]